MATNGVNIIFGGATFLSGDVDEVNRWLAALDENGIKIIDTAEMYGNSEEGLGKAGAAARFIIDTKFPGGFGDKAATEENLVASGQQSLKKLQTKSVSGHNA